MQHFDMLVYSAACEYVRNGIQGDKSSGYMVKNRWSYIYTAPVCLHGLGGNNFRYGNEDSVNVVDTIGNAGLCSEMLLYLVYML